MNKHGRFIIPIFIPHEGCRFRCIFCDQYSVTGIAGHLMTPARIRDTVSRYRETSPGWEGERELAFFGGSFTALPEKRQSELLAVGKELITDGLVDGLRISTRPDAVDWRVINRLVSFGVKTVEIGIQSMDDAVLNKSRRGHTASDSIRAATMLSKRGIEWIAQILPGLPGDTDETIRKTALETAELSPGGIRIYPALVLSGTEMERMYRDGEYIPLSLAHAVALLKEMVDICDRYAIPILRIGLCPSIELERRVVAGPYHPALGTLVHESRLLEMIIVSVHETCRTYDTIAIHVHPREVSRAVGSKRSSISALEQRYPGKRFNVIADSSIQRGRVRTVGL